MSILSKNPLGSNRPSSTRTTKPAPPPSPSEGIFGKNPWMERKKLKDALRRDTGIIPKSYRKYKTSKERLALEEEFGKRARDYVYKKDVEKRIKDLEKTARWGTINPNEKIKLEEKARYLRRLLNG
jgi:hypothetical protein